MAFDPWQPYNQGLANLGQTIQGLGQQDLQRQDAARRNSLADLQMQQGNMELEQNRLNAPLAAKQREATMISLDDKLAEYGAKVAAGQGDINEYYKSKQALERMTAMGAAIKPYANKPGALQAVWPQLTQAFPEFKNVDPNVFKVTPDGIMTPFKTPDGKEVPNMFFLYDNDGKMQIKEVKPDPEILLDKRLAAQAANTDKQIAAADRRAAAQVAASDRKPSAGDVIVAREAVKDLPKLRKEANMASASKARLDQMLNIYDKGSAAGLKGNLLSSVSGVFDIPATSEAELFKKLASAGAGQLRSTVIGPGQVSNYEQKLLQSVSGGGSGARTAIRELLLFYKQEADRTISNYDEAVDAASAVAPSVSKAFKKVGDTPAISGKPQTAPSAPKLGTVQDGYRFKGGNPADPKSWVKAGR